MIDNTNKTQNVIELIDELIVDIKSKDLEVSHLSRPSLQKFDFEFILCMEIVRYELQLASKLSDLTADGMSTILGIMSFHVYERDYPEIGIKCNTLFRMLHLYNEGLKNYDLLSKIKLSEIHWVRFYRKVIKELLLEGAKIGKK